MEFLTFLNPLKFLKVPNVLAKYVSVRKIPRDRMVELLERLGSAEGIQGVQGIQVSSNVVVLLRKTFAGMTVSTYP